MQAGVGRTGQWWGHETLGGMDPDILIFAKGIASGYPMAGLAARRGFDRNRHTVLSNAYVTLQRGVSSLAARLKQDVGMHRPQPRLLSPTANPTAGLAARCATG